MKKKYLLTFVALLCLTFPIATAQSFDSLKRSKGKSSLYAAVEETLAGRKSVAECRQEIATGSLTAPYNGKTPIYLVMDYLATHKKVECSDAEQLLEAFLARSDFDVNLRHSPLTPPLAYLIRTNYDYLAGHFNGDYISDNVLRRMIQAGASVNTYNTDGGTLMDYATATDNKYLQSYFVNQGINLRHEDNKGEDAVYRLIAEGRIEVIKQALRNGNVKIDINSLRNDPKSFAQYKEMYDFLANHCANQATSYEDLTLFRNRFTDKRSLVKQKYERLANQETNAASTFKDIMTVVSRYPDLQAITNPRKLSIYRQDCQKLQSLHTKALAAAQQGATMSTDQYAEQFVELYSKQYQYDPDHKVSLAREVQAYFQVCKGLDKYISEYKWDEDEMAKWLNSTGSMLSGLTLGLVRTPTVQEVSFPGVSEDRQLLKTAIEASRMTSQYGYGRFLSNATATLQNKLNDHYEKANRAERRYNSYKRERDARIEAETRKEMAEKDAKRKREKAIAANPDVSLKSIGITYETSDWKLDWTDIIPMPFDPPDHEKPRYMKVKYSDGTTGSICWTPKNNNYYPSGGEGFFFDEVYTNLTDAIAAEYFFNKYDVTRLKGKK